MSDALTAAAAELDARLGPQTGPPEPLGGGLTNHNVRLQYATGDVVVRIAGEGTGELGIDRGDEAAATQNAAMLGIGPQVLTVLPEHGSLVTRFVPATPLSPAAVRGGQLDAVVRALKTLHDGPPLAARFNYCEVLEDYRATARSHNVPEHQHEELAREIAAQTQAVLTGTEHEPVACHNDLLAANILDDGSRLWIVDWEYAGMNDRYFDLANLAVNNGFTADDESSLLVAYFGWTDKRSLARLRLMRLVSDAREAHWGLVQQGVSTLDFDYAAYADEHFVRLAEAAGADRLQQLLSTAR